MDPKQQLANLMDAFAAAKTSQNELLQKLVLQQVNLFFTTHEIVPITQQNQASSESDKTSWD